MLRYAMYPLVALTFVAANASAQIKKPEHWGSPSRSHHSTPEEDSAAVRRHWQRIRASKPQSAADRARAESTMTEIGRTLDSLGRLAKKDSVAGQ
jgi:hypothetical protein